MWTVNIAPRCPDYVHRLVLTQSWSQLCSSDKSLFLVRDIVTFLQISTVPVCACMHIVNEHLEDCLSIFFPFAVFFCLGDKNAQEEKQILEQRLIALVPPGCEENPPWWLLVEMSENLLPSPPPPLSQSPSPRISRRGIFIKFPGYPCPLSTVHCPLSTHHFSTLLLISSWSWSIMINSFVANTVRVHCM